MSARPPLNEIETWIFDLDNTLYPASCNLFAQIESRMAAFICAELSITVDEAHVLRRHYYQTHGTTLRGLMIEARVEPERFLDYVHAIDVTPVKPAPTLDAALGALPGRKLIFTNASTYHAARVLNRLGIARHFEDIFDIHAAEYLPKPDHSAYTRFVARFGVDAPRAAMVEDIAKNLIPAHALGMTTAWVAGGPDWARAESDALHIHHRVEDLTQWLSEVPTNKTAQREDTKITKESPEGT
jgi:putative hydrolase of the HAD superfamily